MKLATLVPLLPGGGSPSPMRSATDGKEGSAFGSFLTSMAMPGSAARAPIQANAPNADVPAGGRPSSGDDIESEGKSQSGAIAVDGEAAPPETTVAVAPFVAVGSLVAARPAVTSLLTLATRAAVPAPTGLASSSVASPLVADPSPATAALVLRRSIQFGSNDTPGIEEQTSDRLARRASKTDDSVDQPGLTAMTPALAVIGGLVVATSALVTTSTPGNSAATEASTTVARGVSLQTSPLRAGTIADDDALPSLDVDGISAAAITPLAADHVAESETVSSDGKMSTATGVAIGGVPVPPSSTMSIDAAIVPDSLRVESHLGFFRPVSGGAVTATSRAGNGDALHTTPTETATSGGGLVVPATDMVPPGADAASVAVAVAAASRPARAPPSSNDAEPTAVIPAPRAEGATASGELGSGDVPSNSAAHISTPSSKSATDQLATNQPTAPALDLTALTSTTPIVAPTGQSANPVLQQVADEVVGLASTALPDESGLATQVAPARTMSLQLSPAGLGTLTLRLHVAGRALDVHLEASDGRTAALIDRDRETLSSALSGKDYQLKSLSVSTHDATMSGATHAERGPDPGSAGADSSGQPRRDHSSGGRAGDRSSREAPRQDRAEDAAAERGGSSLLV